MNNIVSIVFITGGERGTVVLKLNRISDDMCRQGNHRYPLTKILGTGRSGPVVLGSYEFREHILPYKRILDGVGGNMKFSRIE